jgi:hypothetical protein
MTGRQNSPTLNDVRKRIEHTVTDGHTHANTPHHPGEDALERRAEESLLFER